MSKKKNKSLSESFRKKLGVYAGLYDQTYASLGDMRLILPRPDPKLSAEEAEILRHNVSVWCALNAESWFKTMWADFPLSEGA